MAKVPTKAVLFRRILRLENALVLKNVRDAASADETINDMSDPVEKPDPYFEPLPAIGDSYLFRIRQLYRSAFGDRDRSYQVYEGGVVELTDGSGGDVDLTDHNQGKLVAELLRFAAHLNNSSL